MEIIIIGALLILIAEVTYLVAISVNKHTKTVQAPVFVDTSVLIDGRIISIAHSGFLTRPLYIPRSVVGELQLLADSADPEKRTRARHGLDITKELQTITSIETVIFPDGVRADEGVDNRLLSLAKKHNGALCTVDYNLNKVADVEGIEVLNINELAKTLRMAYLPGEKTRIELTQKGNDSHQAIGHLDDGTMVVVENAHKYIGTIVEVEFVRGLQTAAGKMMFAKLASSRSHQSTSSKKTSSSPRGRAQAQTQTIATATAPGSTTALVDASPSSVTAAKKQSRPQDQARTKTAKRANNKASTSRDRTPQASPKETSQPRRGTNNTNNARSSSAKYTKRQRGRNSAEDNLVELANR